MTYRLQVIRINNPTQKTHDFHIKRSLGSGSHTTTHLAKQQGTECWAVVKVAYRFFHVSGVTPHTKEHFSERCQALLSLRHPNLVSLFSIGEDQAGVPAIAMAYVEGEDLETYLETHPIPSATGAHQIFTQLASVLAYIHATGSPHGDVSLRNVIIKHRNQRRIKVILLDGFDHLLEETCGHSKLNFIEHQHPSDAGETTRTGIFERDMVDLGHLMWRVVTGVSWSSSRSCRTVDRLLHLTEVTRQALLFLIEEDQERRPSAQEILRLLQNHQPSLSRSFGAPFGPETREHDADQRDAQCAHDLLADLSDTTCLVDALDSTGESHLDEGVPLARRSPDTDR